MIEDTPLFAMLARALVGQVVVYFTIVTLLFLVVWKWGEAHFRGARIQARRRVDRKQLAFEIRHALIVLLVGTANAAAVSQLYAGGHTRLTADLASIGWPGVVATFAALLILNDAWFYAWHRLLHHRWFYRHVHAVHHRSVDVNPFSSYSFHWLEGAILGGWVIPVLVVVPIYLPMLGLLQAIGLANNVMSHLGYEFLPRGLATTPVLRWINTSTFHNLHHTSFNTNFGLMFRFWDRVFHTEHPRYEAAFRQRGDAKPVPRG